MRLAGAEKMGFYATPPIALQRITNFLAAERGGVLRILDPCAGEGDAIKYIADHLKAGGATTETYGVELSYVRADKMALKVDNHIQGDWKGVAMTPNSVSLLYNNPPYDDELLPEAGEERRARQEYRFLQQTRDKLDWGGILIYIVPLHILHNARYSSYIINNFKNIRVYRFPAGEYEIYKQVVLFAERGYRDLNAEPEYLPSPESDLPPELPVTPDYIYTAPSQRNSKITFRQEILDDDELTQRVRQYGFHTTRAFLQKIERRDQTDFQPVVPLKLGHVVGLIGSGQMGEAVLGDLLVKGREHKAIDVLVKSVNEETGDATTVERDRFVTTITTINQAGEVKKIPKNGMDAFLTEHAKPLAAVVKEKYDPLYKGASEEEWRVLHPLMKKKLKGRSESGLFVAQKHCATAMKRALDKDNWVTLVGEMGTGKTATSLATAALNDEWPVLVMCPTHITKKWAAEVSLVIPGAKGFVINDLPEMIRFARDWKPGDKWVAVLSKEDAKLAPSWRRAYRVKRDKAQLINANTGKVTPFTANLVVCPKCGKPVNNSKDQPVVDDSSRDELFDLKVPYATDDRRLVCTNPIKKWVGDPHDNSKGKWVKRDQHDQPFICGTPLWQVDSNKMFMEYSDEVLAAAAEMEITDDELGDFAASFTPEHRYKGQPTGDKAWGPGEWVKQGMRRWPIAEYIHDHLRGEHRKGFFKLFIADEVHEYKAKDSAQAMAYHSLRDAIPKVINLTGTIFNGKSTSLFWLLYRNDKEIRRLYEFNSEKGWAETYGRLERTITEGDDSDDASLSYKGKNRNEAKEIPGISPGIFSRLLPHTIFLKKSDLGWKLPPYSEEIIRVDMGAAQAAQYSFMYTTLYERVMDGIKSFDKIQMKEAQRLMSTWLMRSMGRPDSGFRREMVMWKALPGKAKGTEKHRPFLVSENPTFGKDSEHYYHIKRKEDPDLPTLTMEMDPDSLKWQEYCDEEGQEAMFLDRVIEEDCLLPKEQALLSLCRKEIAAGNKMIVFANQTGKNDIQQRLAAILGNASLRVQVLPKTIKPANRGDWLNERAKNIDVLICNPETVKTGLDLVQFNRIAYYEITWNLMTLQQSMARIYRIGQERDTKIYFLVYRGTMEEGFLPLIAQKIRAAALLYGDNNDSVMAEEDEDDSGDLAGELMAKILAGEELTSDGLDSILAPTIEISDEDAWEGYATYEETTPTETGVSEEEVKEVLEEVAKILTLPPKPIEPEKPTWGMAALKFPTPPAKNKKASGMVQLSLFG